MKALIVILMTLVSANLHAKCNIEETLMGAEKPSKDCVYEGGESLFIFRKQVVNGKMYSNMKSK